MTVLIERLNRDTNQLEPFARIDSGRIITGKADMEPLLVDQDGDGAKDVPTEDALLDRFRGPTLFASQVDQAEGAGASPLEKVPPIPSDVTQIDKDALVQWVAWVRAGKPDVDEGDEAEARKFNPELHPRGPDGKFVERPWDIPDDMDVDSIRATPTADLLDELNKAGEPIDKVLASSDIRIDGIPDDVNSVSEAKERLGGDGLVFQDLEAGDKVEIVNPNGQLTKGQIQKTEQVDGGPNRAHVATDSGALHVADVPEGSTIRRDGGPVIPPDEVMDQDPLASHELQPGKKVSVVSGVSIGTPEHAATREIESTEKMGGMDAITVNGEQYAPDHENIQVFDASPDELSFSDVSEGDTVAAFTGSNGSKITEGEVVDTSEAGGNKYVMVEDAESGQEIHVNAATQTLTEPEAVSTDDAADMDVDDGGGGGDGDQADDGPDISDIHPGQVEYEDVPGVDKSTVDSVDEWTSLQKGDWIAYKKSGFDTKVGKIQESPDGEVELVDVRISDGSGTSPITYSGAEKIETISDMGIQQAAEDDAPDVSTIDPSTVSGAAINSDQVDLGFDFTTAQKNDWVMYEDESGVHAGIVKKPTPDEHMVDTGHPTDPQMVTPDELVGKIDPEAVDDIGDEAGTSSPNTQTPDAPDSDFDTASLESNPNTDDVDQDDLYHPATEEGISDVGMLSEDQARAFYEFLEDTDQGGINVFDVVSTEDTSTFPGPKTMEYPQANAYKWKDHIGHWANEVDGIPTDSANTDVENLLDDIDQWKGKSYADWGQRIEKAFHAALDLPGDLRNDGLDGADPTDGEAAIAAMMTASTQEFMRRNWDAFDQADEWGTESDDGELPLYRGVGKNAVASLARDWGEQPDADQITIEASKLGNFSTDPGLAESWGENGIVIKKNATPDDVVFSPDVMSNDITGIQDEAEIWLPGGVSETDPSNIQASKDGKSVADMAEDPADMSKDQLGTLADWASSINRGYEKHPGRKWDYSLQTQQQIDTWNNAKQEMETANLPSYKIEKVEELIDRSLNAINQHPADSPQPQAAD